LFKVIKLIDVVNFCFDSFIFIIIVLSYIFKRKLLVIEAFFFLDFILFKYFENVMFLIENVFSLGLRSIISENCSSCSIIWIFRCFSESSSEFLKLLRILFVLNFNLLFMKDFFYLLNCLWIKDNFFIELKKLLTRIQLTT